MTLCGRVIEKSDISSASLGLKLVAAFLEYACRPRSPEGCAQADQLLERIVREHLAKTQGLLGVDRTEISSQEP